MISELRQKFMVNNFGLASKNVLRKFNLNSTFTIDSIQTDAILFRKTSYDLSLEVFYTKNTLTFIILSILIKKN